MTDLWLDVILAVLAVVVVVATPVLVVTEHRREEPLQPIGDWRDHSVRVPGLSMPAKRRVKGSGPERLRAGDISWIHDPRYQARIPQHLQRTRLPASTYHPSAPRRPVPAATLNLDGLGAWAHPLPATRPHPVVTFTVPIRWDSPATRPTEAISA